MGTLMQVVVEGIIHTSSFKLLIRPRLHLCFMDWFYGYWPDCCLGFGGLSTDAFYFK